MESKKIPHLQFIDILFSLYLHRDIMGNYYVSSLIYPGFFSNLTFAVFKEILVIKVFEKDYWKALSFFEKNTEFFNQLHPLLLFIFSNQHLNPPRHQIKFNRIKQFFPVRGYPGFFCEVKTPEDPRYDKRLEESLYNIKYKTELEVSKGEYALKNGEYFNLNWEVEYYITNVLDTEFESDRSENKLKEWLSPFYLSKKNIPPDVIKYIICFL